MAFLETVANGLFGGQVSPDPYLQQAVIAQRQAQAEQAKLQQVYGQQQGLGSYLQVLAMGGGVSPAQLQLMQGLEAGRRQQMSLGAGLGGNSAGLARFMTAQNTGTLAGQTNQNQAILRAQEQAMARQQLAGLYQGMGQLALGNSGQQIQAGLGYSGLGAGVQQGNAERSARNEAALLGAASGLASAYFMGPTSAVAGSAGSSPQVSGNQLFQGGSGNPLVYGTG